MHGGSRLGAGRKLGSGPYGEVTKVIRVPESRILDIQKFLTSPSEGNVDGISLARNSLTHKSLFLFGNKVPAGFPSPADDYIEKRLDLNEYLISQSEATFFVRIKGDSMIDAGINDNDIVIVDRSRQAKVKDIVLASVDGNFTVKILSKNQKLPILLAANEKYKPIKITGEMQFQVWGVVTGAVRKFK